MSPIAVLVFTILGAGFLGDWMVEGWVVIKDCWRREVSRG